MLLKLMGYIGPVETLQVSEQWGRKGKGLMTEQRSHTQEDHILVTCIGAVLQPKVGMRAEMEQVENLQITTATI